MKRNILFITHSTMKSNMYKMFTAQYYQDSSTLLTKVRLKAELSEFNWNETEPVAHSEGQYCLPLQIQAKLSRVHQLKKSRSSNLTESLK